MVPILRENAESGIEVIPSRFMTERKRSLSARMFVIASVAFKPNMKVTFCEKDTVIGTADPDYDRRSIKVDLTNTPYALFHKDDYLKNHPEEYSPKNLNSRRSLSFSSDDDMQTEDDQSSSDEDADARAIRHKRQVSAERRRALRPNFSGVWKRARIEGFVELLMFSGVSRKAALAAAQKRPVHIIDHDDDYFRVIVKNGLVKVDSHYIIGDEPRIEKAGRSDYEVVLTWGHGTANGKAESLILTSVSVNNESPSQAVEMIAVRTLENNGDILVLQQIVRKPSTGEEARARHIFKRVTDRCDLSFRRHVEMDSEVLAVGEACEQAAAALANVSNEKIIQLKLPENVR